MTWPDCDSADQNSTGFHTLSPPLPRPLTPSQRSQFRPTFPNCSKYCFTSSTVVFTDRPSTKIFFVRVTICSGREMRKWASESCGLPPPAGAPALLPGCQLTALCGPSYSEDSPLPPQTPPWTFTLWACHRQLYTPHPGSLPGVCVRKWVAGSRPRPTAVPRRPHQPP